MGQQFFGFQFLPASSILVIPMPQLQRGWASFLTGTKLVRTKLTGAVHFNFIFVLVHIQLNHVCKYLRCHSGSRVLTLVVASSPIHQLSYPPCLDVMAKKKKKKKKMQLKFEDTNFVTVLYFV